MENREVTLDEVLAFREKKAGIQEEMRMQYPEGIVVSLGMNIPGPVKCSPLIREAFLEGRCSLESLIKTRQGTVLRTVILEENAGFAALYLLSGVDGRTMKEETISLEETHRLGRLFDMDVLENGSSWARTQTGAEKRTCLICGKEAKACARSRSHSVKELQDKVQEIMNAWKREECNDR